MRLQKKCKMRRLFVLVFFFIIALGSFSDKEKVNAADKGTVRIGFFELSGFQEYDKENHPVGYNVEYLSKISEYTGWSYEYVSAESWADAVEMLEQGKVDLVAPAQWTIERAQKFLFSGYSIGTEYGGMLTWAENNDLEYESFEDFNGIRVGCLDSSILKEQFLQYAKNNGFEPDMVYFSSDQKMYEELMARRIDAAVTNYAEEENEKKLLARFAPSPYYYMMRKDSDALALELNQALEKLQSENPAFSMDLMKIYFPNIGITPFTKEEKKYIAKAKTFRVGFMELEPLAYLDQEGNAAGILIDLMKLISKKSGLNFEYVPLSGDQIDYDDLRAKRLDMVMGVEYSQINMNSAGISLTNPFFISKKIMVGKSGIRFSAHAKLKVALCTGSATLQKMLKEKYPNFDLVNYGTIRECLDAVKSKEADIMLQSQYAVEKLLAKPRYDGLVAMPDMGLVEQLSISPLLYREGMDKLDELLGDPRLISILNKAIDQIGDEERSSIVLSYTAGIPIQVTAEDFWYQFQTPILIILFLVSLGILLMLRVIRLQQKNGRLVRKSERELSCITNNINGGVVVLIPNMGFAIQYANNGFAKMIGIEGQDRDSLVDGSYITYIHEEDIPKMNAMLRKERREDDSVELELRIRQKDGGYIPALFHGTIARDEDKTLLYCVVMDISAQKKMMQTIEEEKERYEMLMSQTDDIIFDVNTEERSAMASARFEQMFGWKIDRILVREKTDELFVHPEDLGILEKVIETVRSGASRELCRIRIQTNSGEYLWCDVVLGVSRRDGRIIRFIGKITNVDAQVKDYMRLQQMSQKDGLTGLLNKLAFETEVKAALLSQEDGTENIMMFADLDNFKHLNDTLGHQCGDEMLCYVAAGLRKCFVNGEMLGRFGGDEFFIFLPGGAPDFRRKAKQLGEEIHRSFEDKESGEKIEVTASVGIACPTGSADYETLLAQADEALYWAKENGKGCYAVYQDKKP